MLAINKFQNLLCNLAVSILLAACDKSVALSYQPTFTDAPPTTETVYLFGVHPFSAAC
jgi:hypothetical protein